MKLRNCAAAMLLVSLALAMSLVFTPLAEARCVIPRLSSVANKGGRDAKITVTGSNFYERCNDVVTRGMAPAPMEGAKKIRIVFKQGNRSVLLATVDADASLRFSIEIVVPTNATVGAATFVAEGDNYPYDGNSTDGPRPVSFEVIESRP
jgi:hypothetical protein